MKEIIRKGKSVNEIIDDFKSEFGVKQKDLNYEVIESGSKGFFNLFGVKPTVIKFILLENSEFVKEYISQILNLMNVTFSSIEIHKQNDKEYVSIIGVEEMGFVIGKDGRLIDSLQHLASRMLMNKGIYKADIIVDVDGYREKRVGDVLSKAKSIAKKVIESKRSITLSPMSSSDRKIIHQFIEKEEELRTLTIGVGPRKRIVVFHKSSSPKGREGVQRNHRRPRPPQTKTNNRK